MSLATWARARLRKIMTNKHSSYARALKKPVLDCACLFEAGQGANVHGNMFALARELSWNDCFGGFDIVWVATDDTKAIARNKLARYGIRAEVVVRDSDRYQECLARCRYLFTDNSFPTYFAKRADQTYVNTWHGTPLKRLGHSNLQNGMMSLPNIQKNMLAADFALFPNDLTRDCFFDDYKLRMLFAGKMLHADYPRNDALVDSAIQDVVRSREGLAGKRVVAYMPTWRGASRTVNVVKQAEDLQSALAELDDLLDDDVSLFVNLHFLLGDAIDYSAYRHIRRFPPEYETYDFLAVCDALVTDYSSVMFDFAVTGRKIVLFPYDKDDYLAQVGTYIDFDSLPFPQAMNVRTLAEEIACDEYEPYDDFRSTYCRYHSGHASLDVLETVCLRVSAIDAQENLDRRPVSVRFVRKFTRASIGDSVRGYIECDWPENALLVFKGGVIQGNIDFLAQLPDDVSYLGLVVNREMPSLAKFAHAVYRRSKLGAAIVKGGLKKSCKRELTRLMPNVEIEDVVLYAPSGEYYTYILGAADCPKIAYVKDLDHVRRKRRRALMSSVSFGDYSVVEPPQLAASVFGGRALETYYNDWIDARIITRRAASTDAKLVMSGFMVLRCLPSMPLSNFSVRIPDGTSIGELTKVVKLRSGWIVWYSFAVAAEHAFHLPTHNALRMTYESKEGFGGEAAIQFFLFDMHQSTRSRCAPCIDETRDTALFFRRAKGNETSLMVRPVNPTDYPDGMRRVNAAYWLAKVRPSHDAIVLFEKHSSRYEESASVVFEKLVDAGYDNVWYILDRDYPHRDAIGQKYRSRIVDKNSIEHYRLFFSARTFIGSEMLSHCAELNTSSDKIGRRLLDGKLNYVFLQHGVMYMVSLDSESRAFFKPRATTTGKYRVVTSSEAEKRHFVERGAYKPELLYVCGLPKFDRNQYDADADLIVVMPTWRPWEANLVCTDFMDTGYYRLIERAAEAVPIELREKLVILAHPLFQQHMGDADFPLRKYFDTETRYDDILKRTKVLVTDYSSIAYDAFYRGANVVFYWVDKDECMQAYGVSTTLMIDEYTAFGDVCYETADLARAVEMNYAQGQTERYTARYRHIVNFHDGRNTERLVAMLRMDDII